MWNGIFGVLWDHIRPSWPWLVSLIVVVVALFSALSWRRQRSLEIERRRAALERRIQHEEMLRKRIEIEKIEIEAARKEFESRSKAHREEDVVVGVAPLHKELAAQREERGQLGVEEQLRKLESEIAADSKVLERRSFAPSAEPGLLVENVPREMRVRVPETVEVRVARSGVEKLAEGMTGKPRSHEINVADAMVVRLVAPDDAFLIKPLGSDTYHWTRKSKAPDLQTDDFAAWRWRVTPLRSGQARLDLIVSAWTVDPNGVGAEVALPDQTIAIRVRINYARTVMSLARWVFVAAAGGALGKWGGQILEAVQKLF